MNDLIMGTTHEDMKLISYVENAEFQASRAMNTYFQEMYQNYRRANGHIYNNSDLEKLNLEKRPAFVYNLFRPILLHLAGNYRQNLGKIECQPRTPNDIELVNIANDLMDYAILTANNFEYETVKAYINSIIGRVGWIYGDYRYDIDDQGMFWYESYNPFRILFDISKGSSNQKKWNYEIDRGFYTTEEIRNIFAQDDMDKYDEITEKSKLLLGESDIRRKQILTMIERVYGIESYYQGQNSGYDAYSQAFNNLQTSNPDYIDTDLGKFKVIDFHERRSEAIITAYFPKSGKELDITKSIDKLVDSTKDHDQRRSKAYRNAIAAFSDRTFQAGYGEVIIKRKLVNQIHQTAVCPALNMVLADDPYTVQNGNFKILPVFCFEMDQEVLEWKSYIDDLVDPVRGINLNINTMQTHSMKSSQGETWYEEDALKEHEEEFTHNTINAYKKVARGGLEKIKRVAPPPLPKGNMEMTMILQELVKQISTVRDNAVGKKENSEESGKLFTARVAQTDLLQIIPQDNAVTQLKTLGENCIDNLIFYMPAGRVIRIIGDEKDPYWLQINKDSIDKLFYNGSQLAKKETVQRKIQESKFDIMISRVPYGQGAKEREFQEILMICKTYIEMDRPDLIMPEFIIKFSNLRNKDEWMNFVKMMTKNQGDVNRAQQAQLEKESKLTEMERLANVEKTVLENNELEKENQVDDMIKGVMSEVANSAGNNNNNGNGVLVNG